MGHYFPGCFVFLREYRRLWKQAFWTKALWAIAQSSVPGLHGPTSNIPSSWSGSMSSNPLAIPGAQLPGPQNPGCRGDPAGLSLPPFPAAKGHPPDSSEKEARSQGRAQGDFRGTQQMPGFWPPIKKFPRQCFSNVFPQKMYSQKSFKMILWYLFKIWRWQLKDSFFFFLDVNFASKNLKKKKNRRNLFF